MLKEGPVVDIGSQSTMPINIQHPWFHNLLGATTIHQMAALMERSRLLISPVTGTLHLAAACGLPILSIVGGSEPAVATGISRGRSLVDRPSCANCYESGPCISDFQCLWAIKPGTVYELALSMLEQPGGR
ncbi:MAG: glycosyltransferase family 9 protein [Pyrinomonadaceae bacterium]